GLSSLVTTTGGKGLHVVAPLRRTANWDEVKEAARNLAGRMAQHEPRRYLAHASRAHRRGRVYVDYLRNGQGATAIGAYSTRARPGAPVATPLAWEELEAGATPGDFNV